MNAFLFSIEKIDEGKNLLIKFDDNSQYSISAELLRVESPSERFKAMVGPR